MLAEPGDGEVEGAGEPPCGPPESAELAERCAELVDAPMVFTDLNVVDDQTYP